MAISFVGKAEGTNTVTPPTHSSGDLFIGFCFRDGSNTPPTIPGDWTTIRATTGANTCSSCLAYKFAASSSETFGTWTNATSAILHVYRGTSLTIGDESETGGASTTVTYPALTPVSGSFWAVVFAGHRSTNTALENAPSGTTNRSTVVDATDEAAGHDTNGTVSSWPDTNVSVGGTSSGWRAMAVEIYENISTGIKARLPMLGVG